MSRAHAMTKPPHGPVRREPRLRVHPYAPAPVADRQRMLAAVPGLQRLDVKEFAKHIDFGPLAFSPIDGQKVSPVADPVDTCLQAKIAKMVTVSVQGASRMRGQRGEMLVTEMMTSWYTKGLSMHGPPGSPMNSMIIPAARHIFALMAKLPPQHPKRVDCLTTLALSCQDCQQVQAREILRIFGDLTSQNATLEGQLKYSLVREKEAALNRYISRRHPQCDLDHRQVQPPQQRVHLFSGYVSLIGERFGLDGVVAARSDRFLDGALREIGHVDVGALISQLKESMSVKDWLQTLLADINNQAEDADRLVDRACLFEWAHKAMGEDAHSIFYDPDRADEFAGQVPAEPTEANKFQPFLSCRSLVDILLTAGMLTWTSKLQGCGPQAPSPMPQGQWAGRRHTRPKHAAGRD